LYYQEASKAHVEYCIIQDFKSFLSLVPDALRNIRNSGAAAGFDADEVKATADAYEKLDGCCKAK